MPHMILSLILGTLLDSGSIILLVGVVITLPFAFCTVAYAYKEVFGLKEEGSP